MTQRGFTLIELLITLAIAAILATIALPSFSNFLDRQQLASDVNQMISVLSFARSEAIKRRTDINAVISSGPPWSITVTRDGETLRQAEGDSSEITISGSCVESNIKFTKLGAANESCSFTINHPNAGSEVVEVSLAGGIRRP